jgi:hypothetical protein
MSSFLPVFAQTNRDAGNRTESEDILRVMRSRFPTGRINYRMIDEFSAA